MTVLARRAIGAAVRALVRHLPGEASVAPGRSAGRARAGGNAEHRTPSGASDRPLDLIEAWEAVILGHRAGPDTNEDRAPD